MHIGSRLHRSPLALVIAAAILTAACTREAQPAGDPATTASPAPTAVAPAPVGNNYAGDDDGSAGVAAFLASTYGPGAKLSGEWTGAPTDSALHAKEGEQDNRVTREVCERETVTLAGKPAVLLAVCGVPKDFGHPTPGITDFFLLQDQGSGLAATAKAHFEEFGSMGNAGEIDSERFGAELYGFTVESGFTGQGYTVSRRTLLLPKDGSFHEAATFLDGMDDNVLREGCTNDSPMCAPGRAYDVEFEMDIDDSNPGAAAYPVVVTEEGKACGKPAQGQHRLTLDPATLTYKVPAALNREEGCP